MKRADYNQSWSKVAGTSSYNKMTDTFLVFLGVFGGKYRKFYWNKQIFQKIKSDRKVIGKRPEKESNALLFSALSIYTKEIAEK